MNICIRVECQKETKNPKFCSRSCSIAHNNKLNPKRALKGKCNFCNEAISSSRKFCNRDCYSNFRRSLDAVTIGKTKRCSSCKNILDYSKFGVNRTTRDGLMRQCKVCNNSRVNSYNKGRRSSVARIPQWKKHGLTEDRWNKMSKECEVCGKTKNLVIDHDHKCCSGEYSCGKCVRGILCSRCNMAIGSFQDRVDLLNEAALYLSRTDAREAEGASFTH